MLSNIFSLATFALAISPRFADFSGAETYTHAEVPGYVLTSTDPASLNLDSVKQQTGYLTTPSGNNLFYWYFESRSDPKNDPTVVWLNGGPGCSSMESVLFENGPSRISTNNVITRNEWSWNDNANVLYIDNPAGVGYSLASTPISNTVEASNDFKYGIKLFFEKNQQLKKNKLHITGESYAGRYIPVFAEGINEFSESPVKVSSVMIGNGVVNPIDLFSSYQPMLCGQGGYPSVFSSRDCELFASDTTQCINALTRYLKNKTSTNLALAEMCYGLENWLTGLNPYDIRQSSCAPSTVGLCYPALDNVQEYFNEAVVKRAIGVNTSQNYQICNYNINAKFMKANDELALTYQNVTRLLETGTAVLVYNGDADIAVNWLGSHKWTNDLQWSGHSAFEKTALTDWKPRAGQKRGQVKNYENFTFLRVSESGHMVPHDQPESASYMLKSWLKGDYAFKDTF